MCSNLTTYIQYEVIRWFWLITYSSTLCTPHGNWRHKSEASWLPLTFTLQEKLSLFWRRHHGRKQFFFKLKEILILGWRSDQHKNFEPLFIQIGGAHPELWILANFCWCTQFFCFVLQREPWNNLINEAQKRFIL